MMFKELSVRKVSPVILVLTLSVPGASGQQKSGRTMSPDEIVERLARAQSAEAEILLHLASGGRIRGRVAEVSRRSFVLRYGPRKHGGLPAVIAYNKITSVKQYNRVTRVLVTLRDRALPAVTLVPFLGLSGIYYLLTGQSLQL
jgi:hypothetical protein